MIGESALERICAYDGRERGPKGLAGNGIDGLQYLLGDTGSYDGGVLKLQSVIERIVADECKRDT